MRNYCVNRFNCSNRVVIILLAVLVFVTQFAILPPTSYASELGDELYAAVNEADEKEVKKLIAKGANVDFKTEEGGWTCLHVAAQSGLTPIVEVLLGAGANPSPQEDAGWTPLHMAIYAGQVETAKILIENGAKVDLANSGGSTPLDLAVYMELNTISELIAARGGKSKTAGVNLYNAASSGDLVEVERLIGLGADVNIKAPDGYTPLHVAAFAGHTKVVRFLLANGADKEGLAGEHYTPLMTAAQEGHAEVVSILATAGANVGHVTNSGVCAMNVAADRGHVAVAKVLFEHGADPNQGSTRPLFYAVEQNRPEMVKLLIEHSAVVNPDKDWEPNSAMHIATRTGNLEITMLLVSLGAKPNVWNYKREAPLDLAIASGNTKLVKYLESKGARKGSDLDLVRVVKP